MGEGNAPPEDVGGVTGYINYLEIVRNPKHEEYQDTLRWAKGQWYEDLDILAINRRLKNIL
jgi:hypothetical protein